MGQTPVIRNFLLRVPFMPSESHQLRREERKIIAPHALRLLRKPSSSRGPIHILT